MANIGSKIIVRRYVRALFALAKEQGKLDGVATELDKVENAMAVSPELAALLSNPLINRKKKAETVDAVLAALKAGELTRKFFGTLAANRRLDLTLDFIAHFREELAREREELSAEVISALPLSAAQRREVAAALAKRLGSKVNIEVKSDGELMGGMVIKIGGLMLDASLRGKLARLQQNLKSSAQAGQLRKGA